MICPKCGADEPDLNGACSATEALICQGHSPESGCGSVLTPHDRHWYGSVCEKCEIAWSARIGSWRTGGEDPELDAMFDDQPRRQ